MWPQFHRSTPAHTRPFGPCCGCHNLSKNLAPPLIESFLRPWSWFGMPVSCIVIHNLSKIILPGIEMTMTIVLYFLGRNLDFSNAGPDFRQVRKDNRRQCRQLIETSNQGQDHASGGAFPKKKVLKWIERCEDVFCYSWLVTFFCSDMLQVRSNLCYAWVRSFPTCLV